MTIPNLYWLTAAFGMLGCLSFGLQQGWKSAAGFALGAVGSLLNLWLWGWLVHSIEPTAAPRKRNWQAGLFVGRYIVLWAAGYAIVKVLGVPPFAVVTGLLSSTAAVLASLVIEIIRGR